MYACVAILFTSAGIAAGAAFVPPASPSLIQLPSLIYTALPSATASANVPTFTWDCSTSAGPCNNACFAVYNRGAPTLLSYDIGSPARSGRRYRAGCRSPSACKNPAFRFYQAFSNPSCDEYPFASVAEGGNGAILRCTEKAENGIDDEDAGTDDGSGNPDEIYNDGTDDSTPGSQGAQLGAFYRDVLSNQPGQFYVSFQNTQNSPFCNGAAQNDGYEFAVYGPGAGIDAFGLA